MPIATAAVEATIADSHRRIFNVLANGDVLPGTELSRELATVMCTLATAMDAFPIVAPTPSVVCGECSSKLHAHEKDGAVRVSICAKCERETIKGAAEESRTDAAYNRGEW